MSSSSTSSLSFLGQQITSYSGTIILVFGVIGGLLNLIVFLSLETFRQSSCAFYLTVMSFVNIGQLLFGLLSRILIAGFGIDWTLVSPAYCKFRVPFAQLCTSMSYACLCLATIDQYFATCTRPRWQQWSSIKLAHRLLIISFLILTLMLIPYPIFLDDLKSATGKISCNMNNTNMLQYRNYFMVLLMAAFIPDLISGIFGFMAYRNIQHLSHRTTPLIRRELDKQLTTMVLVQVVINFFTSVPSASMTAVVYATTNIKDSSITDIIQFTSTVAVMVYYTYFAVREGRMNEIVSYYYF